MAARRPVLRCRSCQAPIRWIRTPRGRAMPIDVDVITTDDARAILYTLDGTVVPRTAGVLATGHQSHFVSCPQRAQWRGVRAES